MKKEVDELLQDLFVGFAGDGLEVFPMRAPHAVHHEGGCEHPRGDARIDAAELAGFDALGDEGFDESVSACDDFLGVESCKVGEVLNLGMHEPENRSELGGSLSISPFVFEARVFDSGVA